MGEWKIRSKLLANNCSSDSFSKLFRNIHRKATVTIVSDESLSPFTAHTYTYDRTKFSGTREKVHAASVSVRNGLCALRFRPKITKTFLIYTLDSRLWKLWNPFTAFSNRSTLFRTAPEIGTHVCLLRLLQNPHSCIDISLVL